MFDVDACEWQLREALEKAKASIGEIREWKGIKYQKQTSGRWIPLKGQGVKKKHYPKLEELYGTNYSQYQGDPEEAIKFLLEEKKGQVIGAYEREGLGRIDIVWGDDEKGLRHIRKRHFVEQDDFSSYEDMAEKISNVLKNGESGNYYSNGSKVDIKDDTYQVTLVKEVVYDEDDNFKDKVWILTSFDYSKPIKDKIRKQPLTDEEIASIESRIRHSSNSSEETDMDSERSSTVICPKDSGSKSTTNSRSNQQSLEKSLVLDIEKSRKGLPIGTTKEFSVNGRRVLYIKTEKGWRPKSKGGPSRSKQEDGGMGIKVSDFSDKTRELFDEAKKDNKLLRNFVDQLIEADFPSKDIFSFIKKEFKLGPKSQDHYEDVLQLKAYWRPSTGEFSDKNEVASWLHDEVMRMTKSKNPHGETLDPEQTKELIEKFQKRYDLDSYSQAEKILKGLAFNGTKEYTMAFDTNFGQYHFYIGKRQTEESSKKESLLYTDKDIRVVEIRAFAENEFQNRINSFVKYKGKNYAVTALTSKDANARGYTIHIDKVTYLNSGVKESKERDRAIVWALNHSLYQDFESIKDSSKEEQKEALEETSPTIKQITQTYVKVGGDTILIRMNKDKTRYKASKGDFKVESGEGEDLTSFK